MRLLNEKGMIFPRNDLIQQDVTALTTEKNVFHRIKKYAEFNILNMSLIPLVPQQWFTPSLNFEQQGYIPEEE